MERQIPDYASRIQAKQLHIGDQLCEWMPGAENPIFTWVDDVRTTRDGEIMIRTGFDGTGTMWLERDEYVIVIR